MDGGKSPEEKLFDQVARFLYKGSLKQARKEFYLQIFAEWSRTNLDIILKAISLDKLESENMVE